MLPPKEIYATCVYCHQPIYRGELPRKALDGDRKAHLTCWLDHEEKRDKPPNPDDTTPKP